MILTSAAGDTSSTWWADILDKGRAAVFEDMGVKETVFKKLDEVMKPGAILASNTSTLDVNAWDGARGLMSVYTYLLTELVGANVARDADRTAACRALGERTELVIKN